MDNMNNLKKKKSTKRKIYFGLSGILAFLVLLAAGYTVFLQPKLSKEELIYKEASVEFGDLQVSIMESGAIETEEEIQKYDLDLVEDTDGNTSSSDDDEDLSEILKFEKVYAVVGQKVSTGDPIYGFQDSTVQTLRRKLTLAVSEAATALSEAEISCSLKTLEAEVTCNSEMLSSSTANEIYELENAKDSNEVSSYFSAVSECNRKIETYQKIIADYQKDDKHDGITNYEELKQSYENKKKEYENADKNNERTFVTIQDSYLKAKDAYETMLTNIKNANENIKKEEENIQDYIQKYQNKCAGAAASESKIRQQQEIDNLAGDYAKATYEYAVLYANEEVTDAKKELETAQENLTSFDELIGEGIVYAKCDGMITRMNYEVNDVLKSSSDLYSYITEKSIQLTVDVSQEDILHIAVGDKVAIQFNAYDGEDYQGEVTGITTTSTSEQSKTISYPVTILVEGDTSKLYDGMTGEVTFVTKEKKQVLYISKKAIMEENGKEYVLKKDSQGNLIKKDVVTGFTDGIHVEIVDGLEKGDNIVIVSKVTNEQE